MGLGLIRLEGHQRRSYDVVFRCPSRRRRLSAAAAGSSPLAACRLRAAAAGSCLLPAAASVRPPRRCPACRRSYAAAGGAYSSAGARPLLERRHRPRRCDVSLRPALHSNRGCDVSSQIAPVPGFVSPPIVSTVPAPTSLASPITAAPALPSAPLPTPTAPPPSTVAAAAPLGFYFNPTPEHFNALALYQGLLQAGSSSMPSSSFAPSVPLGGLASDPYGYGGAYGGAHQLGLLRAPAPTPTAAPPGPSYGAAPPPGVPSPAAYAMAGAPAGGVAPFYIAHLIPVKLSPDNYLAWRAQVLPLLRSRHLEGFIDGSLPCPPSYHPAYHQWVAQDQAILSRDSVFLDR
nr:leucine-rich repeat extensin-like protein 5 [Lolium perenne]